MSERDVTKDPMSAHEVLDRAFMISEMFAQFIASHPFTEATKELHEKAEQIALDLGAFYQLAGKYALDGD